MRKNHYIIHYPDCLYVPIKEELSSAKRAIYVIVGIDANGYKDVLGIWKDNTESATFWHSVFEDLKNRGVEDILYMTSDGIAGFKGSLEDVFPKTLNFRCIVHLDRNIYNFSPRKDAKEILKDFKEIYKSASLDEAELNLANFETKYENSHKNVVKKVKSFMQYIEPLFDVTSEIRHYLYTSNAIESVNSALRKVTRGKGSFANENSLFKVLYLRINELTEKWNKPVKNWNTISLQLAEIHKERFTKYIDV